MKSSVIIFVLLLIYACSNSIKKNKAKQLAEIEKIELQPSFNKIDKQTYRVYHDSVKRFFYANIAQTNFSGQFLVAKNGKVLFESYTGFQNREKGRRMSYKTPIHVASISKTITALAILRMVDRKQLNLDDSVQVYLKKFPYHGITIRMLLNHRSGIPYYGYLPQEQLPDSVFITNKRILPLFKKNKVALYFPPNTQFSYCNTNYALLALIVEKVSKSNFPDFIKKDILDPLNMSSSFVFSGDTSKFKEIGQSYNSKGINQGINNLDFIYGDKNFYTTAVDLLKLDKATYSTKFLSSVAKKEMFKGYSYENPGLSNYGLGFRLREEKGRKTLFFHTGWWHGNTGCYATLRKDTVCMIVLSNQYTRRVFSINSLSLLFGKYCAFSLIDPKENFINTKEAKIRLQKSKN